ncbi:MAG: acyltransferase domain-containing protein, partial [Desulfobacterales bacterium]|nr:acyltransferase domain-containing protein [Desulfobacterales bacterium]
SGSIYAPNENGQAKALRMAYRDAGISTDTVELIEAHGTGTRVGDAVEFSALKNVFSESVKNGNKCALGSVKSMIGHTKAAAGAAGLIKGALALHHKVIPPTLKADKPDPKLNITESPFYLNTKTKPWIKKSNHPRRCGVSAFGFGGSNFHVVLEEYESQKHEISWDGTVDITAFSAPDKKGLIGKLNDFKDSIRNDTSRNGISYYTSKTRKEFSQKDTFRLLIVSGKIDSVSNLINIAISAMVSSNYKTLDDHSHIYFSESQKPGKLAFIFPGQGSQYAFMGNDLACRFPEAGIILEYANDIFNEHNDNGASFKRLTDYIYPQTPKKSIDDDALRNTDIAQPAIGAVSLCMLKILERFDLQPDAVCGHSFGELTALCSAGWIEEETFLSLSSARGRFMAKAGGNTGTMLAVKAPLDELELLIKKNSLDVVLANRNSYEQGVLSGPEDEILKAEKYCKEKGFRTIHLPVSAAFHSRLVKDAAEPFMKTVQKAKINPSETPVYSNTTGTVYPDDPVKVKKLLGHQLLHPVDFVSQIENLYKEGVRTFVEVGPKSILTGLVTSILKGRDSFAVSSDGSSGRRSGVADLAHLLCRLASLGYDVNLENWEDPA